MIGINAGGGYGITQSRSRPLQTIPYAFVSLSVLFDDPIRLSLNASNMYFNNVFRSKISRLRIIIHF